MAKEKGAVKILAVNKRGRFNYIVEESVECGIELLGTEVKSVKSGRFSFSDAYGRLRDGEVWLIGLHISPYPFANIHNHDPERERRLLLHKQEIKRLRRKVDERGYTLVPMKFFLARGLVKLNLGVCRGKKTYDKREAIKRRDQKRDEARELKYR
jgi:SsrA-binding protein